MLFWSYCVSFAPLFVFTNSSFACCVSERFWLEVVRVLVNLRAELLNPLID